MARRILGPLLKLPARRFAMLMAEVDRRVALNGIVAAAQWLLTQIVTGVDARGTDNIPRTGPVLIASNHPGAYDIVALIAGIGRDDHQDHRQRCALHPIVDRHLAALDLRESRQSRRTRSDGGDPIGHPPSARLAARC